MAISLSGQIKLPRLIADGVVFQRDTKLKIWGWASAKEEVSVIFKERRYQTKTDVNGHWEIAIPRQPAGGPYDMTFKGKNEITIHNILFGDVWICSGQSNMELTMERVKDKYPFVIANSTNENIRQFLVPDQYDFKKERVDFESGEWQYANPKNILSFSAVAYFFAKEIYERQHVPIGLINAALGGSPAEAWMSEDALISFPNLHDEFLKYKDDNLIHEIESKDDKRISDWYHELNDKDQGGRQRNNWVDLALDDRAWSEMLLPGYWADGPLQSVNGSVWFRKKFNAPQSFIGKPAKLWLGRIVDQDSVFINGRFIGTTGYQYPPRKYEISPAVLNEGENVIAVKVISNSGRGGFVPDKPYYVMGTQDTINLTGLWKYKLGTVMPALTGATAIRWKPVGLYNRMISPLLKHSIKGVIWYQGEASTQRADEYQKLFPFLIADWRKKWRQGDFPFLFVQLANFMEPKSYPSESNWAALRDAQRQALAVTNTGMAVTIDLGEWNDIHPLNKEDVGKRLALLALHMAYNNKTLVYSGPTYKSAKRIGTKIEISFSSTGSGLVAAGGDLKYFSIAGPDRKFAWADAKIDGNKVVVWSDEIKNPMLVRYAWADNPDGANLNNKDGLPASPFSIELKKEP